LPELYAEGEIGRQQKFYSSESTLHKLSWWIHGTRKLIKSTTVRMNRDIKCGPCGVMLCHGDPSVATNPTLGGILVVGRSGYTVVGV
jgi:hypothetical protein